MEAHPLQDTLPPRHQVESDESEDEDAYPAVSSFTRSQPSNPVVNLSWNHSEKTRQNILFALYEAGRFWTKGVQLGDFQGDIILNDTVIGNIYAPRWADAFILAIDTRVPLYTIHAIVSTTILSTRAKSICIIDSYSLPLYVTITLSPSNTNPPIRCLQVHTKMWPSKALTFSPPNILQSLAASLLSFAEFQGLPATLLLLPSSYTAPAAPPTVMSNTFGPSIREEWGTKIMEDLHSSICATLGSQSTWKYDGERNSLGTTKRSKKGDIGEGGMYL